MIPLPTPLLFLYNFLPNILPNFLYAFIGISLETVGGMGYGVCMWCYGLVWVGSGWYIIDTTAVTLRARISRDSRARYMGDGW